jgi:hypothetical protein
MELPIQNFLDALLFHHRIVDGYRMARIFEHGRQVAQAQRQVLS